jgi:LPS-assembly lipoprotein
MTSAALTSIFVKRLAIVLLALGVAACGFHLRGQGETFKAADIPNPLHITGLPADSALLRELSAQFELAGVRILNDPAGSAAVLRLGNPRSGSRLLSVDSRNKAVEYELLEAVTFSLATAEGIQTRSPQTVSVTRIQYRPEGAVLGSDNEAELLRGDMRRDLATQILIRLAAR